MLPKIVDVVPAFEADNHFRTDLEQFCSHVEVSKGAQVRPTELIMNRRVEATRDEDQVWVELPCDWKEQLFTSMLVFIGTERVLPTLLPADIHIVSFAFALPNMVTQGIHPARVDHQSMQ